MFKTAVLILVALSSQEKGVPSPEQKEKAPATLQDRSAQPERGLIPTQDWIKRDADPRKVATSLEIVVMLTLVSLAPALLMLLTSFTRIVIVLSFVRRALATQDLPPNQVIVGLSVILTFLVMTPVLSAVKRDALDPYTTEQIGQKEAIDRGTNHLRAFMFKHARPQDLTLFMEATRQPAKA